MPEPAKDPRIGTTMKAPKGGGVCEICGSQWETDGSEEGVVHKTRRTRNYRGNLWGPPAVFLMCPSCVDNKRTNVPTVSFMLPPR